MLSESEYRQLDHQLSTLDDAFFRFAKEAGARAINNLHAPERRISYLGRDRIERALIVSPVMYDRIRDDPKKPRFAKRASPTFIIAMAAWLDSEGKRRSWHRILKEVPTLPSTDEMLEILRSMYRTANEVTESDLS